MKTRKRSALCTTIERALFERDRREMASIERLLKALKIEARQDKRAASPRPHRGR